MEKNTKIALGILAGIIIGYFVFRKKPTQTVNLEEELKDLAKSVSDNELKNLISILNSFSSPKNKFSENEKQMWLRVYKGILLAKKDKKWDDKSKDLKAKKTILLSYGVKGNEIDWFIKRT
jgi:hypothetical protein